MKLFSRKSRQSESASRGSVTDRLRFWNNKSSGQKKGDRVLFGLVLGLMIFGLVMIASIGVPKSIELSISILKKDILYPNCSDAGIDCYRLLKGHFFRLLAGGVAFFIVTKIPSRYWKKIAVFFYGMTVFTLLLVLIIGKTSNTFAKSWLPFFNTTIQPIEFAKLALIFYLAHWMERKNTEVATFQYGFLPFVMVTGIMILPIALQPDLGGTLVVAIIAVSMFFAAGARLRHLALGAFVAFLMAIILVTSVGRVRERFQTFWGGSEVNCVERSCWQSEQANIAVGSGGFWGKGLTQGVQKSYWLPQASDDFIFAASAEELGFLRISILVIVYAIIAWRGFRIAMYSPSRFNMLSAVGITAFIVGQAFVNIAVNLALMPVTGITLPFISYGGSSMISVLIAVGVLIHISKETASYPQTSNYETGFERRRDRRSYPSQYRSYS